MKRMQWLAVMCAALMFLLPGQAIADHLSAPTGLVCPVVNGVIEADWDDLIDPNTGQPVPKYSVNIVATYDTGVIGDASDDTTIDFDFGTSDRTDGALISQSDLDIALSALLVDFGAGPIAPYDVQVRVKGLHSGKGQGRQDNLFSAFCDAV
jgi:hypothetical protein